MKKLTLFLLIATVLVACRNDSFLDTTPYGLASDETFFRNEDDALLAINATYFGLRQWCENFGGDYGWGNIGTDDAWKGGASPEDMADLFAKETYQIISTIGAISARWPQSYQGISNANKVIDNVPGIEGMDEALKNRIVGEAYFLRGAYYYDLARLYGGVPIFRENLELTAYLDIPRSSREETWAFAEENFLEALNRLPKKSEYSKDDIGRATKGAALGFLTRMSAIRKDMGKVKQYAEQLFALNEYTIEGVNYTDIWTPEGENGPGSIFEVQIHEAGQGWGPRLGNASGVAYSPRSGSPYGGWGFVMAKQELLDEYEEGDPRFDATLYNVEGQPYAPLDGENSWFGRKVAYAPFSAYPAPAAANDGGVNWRVIRLAGIYTLYAEALYAAGDEDGAREYINRIRARARGENTDILPDVTASGPALLEAIYHERRIELALEGVRFDDLVRTGRTDLLAPMGFDANKHALYPIPQVEIDNYSGKLEQNPGY